MPTPARDTAAGRIYNDLRNLARRTGTPTDQDRLAIDDDGTAPSGATPAGGFLAYETGLVRPNWLT